MTEVTSNTMHEFIIDFDDVTELYHDLCELEVRDGHYEFSAEEVAQAKELLTQKQYRAHNYFPIQAPAPKPCIKFDLKLHVPIVLPGGSFKPSEKMHHAVSVPVPESLACAELPVAEDLFSDSWSRFMAPPKQPFSLRDDAITSATLLQLKQRLERVIDDFPNSRLECHQTSRYQGGLPYSQVPHDEIHCENTMNYSGFIFTVSENEGVLEVSYELRKIPEFMEMSPFSIGSYDIPPKAPPSRGYVPFDPPVIIHTEKGKVSPIEGGMEITWD